jgi:hypothetical protein
MFDDTVRDLRIVERDNLISLANKLKSEILKITWNFDPDVALLNSLKQLNITIEKYIEYVYKK